MHLENPQFMSERIVFSYEIDIRSGNGHNIYDLITD